MDVISRLTLGSFEVTLDGAVAADVRPGVIQAVESDCRTHRGSLSVESRLS